MMFSTKTDISIAALSYSSYEKYRYPTSLLSYNPGQNSWDYKGNKPVKMTYFLPSPPPDAMLMSGIQVIFGRLNIA